MDLIQFSLYHNSRMYASWLNIREIGRYRIDTIFSWLRSGLANRKVQDTDGGNKSNLDKNSKKEENKSKTDKNRKGENNSRSSAKIKVEKKHHQNNQLSCKKYLSVS